MLARLAPIGILLALGACSPDAQPDNGNTSTGTLARESAPPTADRPASDQHPVIGTIRATLGGEERTWYVLAATVDGEQKPSAIWTIPDEGSDERMALIGGYDTEDVPFETFEGAPDQVQSNFGTGEYEGSLLNISFAFSPGESSASFGFPGADANVVYVSDVSLDALTGMYSLEEGELAVTTIDAQRDGARFAGSFSGTLTAMDQSRSIQVIDGRFEITDAAYMEVPEDQPNPEDQP